MAYKSFLHVERLDKAGISDILSVPICISPKLDGTNACVYWDSNNLKVAAGSRTRAITPENDNAGFAAWLESDNPQAFYLRSAVAKYPQFIFYGEWLGSTKFVGKIKKYKKSALNQFWIFDVFDTTGGEGHYCTPAEADVICNMCGLNEWRVPHLAIGITTIDEIKSIADNNHYLLEENEIGEGIVVKGQDVFYDVYGHPVYGKYVRPSFQETNKKNLHTVGEIEQWIVDTYLTDAELGKAAAKIKTQLDINDFIGNNKAIGMFLNLCWKDTIEENIIDILKKKKMPIIDFSILQNLVKSKARLYINL